MPWNEGAEKAFKKDVRTMKKSPRKKARRLKANRIAAGMRGDLQAMGVSTRALARGRQRPNKR